MVIMTLLMTAILFFSWFVKWYFCAIYDDVSIVPTFMLQPLTYLGGVFYAISMLPPFWQAVSKVNIVYMISGFRYGFLGVQDVPIGISMTILILFIVVFYMAFVGTL